MYEAHHVARQQAPRFLGGQDDFKVLQLRTHVVTLAVNATLNFFQCFDLLLGQLAIELSQRGVINDCTFHVFTQRDALEQPSDDVEYFV